MKNLNCNYKDTEENAVKESVIPLLHGKPGLKHFPGKYEESAPLM